MRRVLLWIAGFLAAAAWFASLLSWSGFSDPDVFYHAKMALLIWQQHGPVMAFPWLDLTFLGRHFADLHLLFHVFMAPFVATFGLFNGARIVSVLLCAAFTVTFYACLRTLKMPYALWWTILLSLTQPFLVRMSLGKATPIAVLWFILGLTLLWKRRPRLVGLVTMAYALTHGGWPYLAGSCLLVMCGEIVYARTVLDKTLKEAIRLSPWRETLAAFVGAAFGLLVHPNFPDVLILGWTQIFTIGLGTPFKEVMLGIEWLPTDIGSLIVSFAPWIVAMFLGLLGLLLAPKKPLAHPNARLLTSFGWVLAVLVALTLKSRRNVEYLAPLFALWIAALWSLVDVPKLLREVRESLIPIPRKLWYVLCPFVVLLLVAIVLRGPWEAWKVLHPSGYPDLSYRAAMKPISDLANPGDRVFHSSWDEFPLLFAIDDRVKYISGYDPTLLYIASSTLSDQVRDVTWGVTTSTPEATWDLIHDQLHSRFVFITKPNHMAFYDLIVADHRYQVLYDASDTAAFLIPD